MLEFGGILDLWGGRSTFLGKGTAETRLFGEGNCVFFRQVGLDRGWCNIQSGVGEWVVLCWIGVVFNGWRNLVAGHVCCLRISQISMLRDQ